MAAFLGTLLSALLPAESWPNCGAESCTADAAGFRGRPSRSVRLSYEFEYIDQDKARIGRRSAAVGEIRGHHDEHYTLNRLHRLGAVAGFSERLSADLRVPFVVRSHGHVHHHTGKALENAWSLSGLGDISLLARGVFYKPSQPRRPALFAILGGKFPTGRDAGFLSSGDESGDAEPTVTPGTGSWDLILGGGLQQETAAPGLDGGRGAMPLFLSLSYQINGPSREGYRVGNAFEGALGASYPAAAQLGFLAQLNLRIRERDYKASTREETEKTGGEFLYVSPGLDWRFREQWNVYVLAQLPVYQRVNSIQLTAPYGLLGGIAYRFGI